MAIDRPQVIASAEKLVSRGKIEAAIKEYRKLLAENPNDASTLNRLGDLYARIDRIDEAVKLFSQIADRYTDDGFFVKAIAIYKKIIKLDPTRLAVYERLAELYHKQGLIPEARTQYQVLVDYYQKHANSASAISVLQKMASLIPDDPAPHVKLAELFHSQQLTDKALAEYRLIADLMLRHNKVEEATQVYAKAIEAEPGDIAFITDAVLGLKDAGYVGAAARLLALAVERNPQAEKIARIAGLHRAAPAAPPPISSTPLKVSDVTRSGVESRALPEIDLPQISPTPTAPIAVEPSHPLRTPAPTPPPELRPAAEPSRPSPLAPQLLHPIDDGEVDFVLELPEEVNMPPTLVSPTDEMLRRSPDSPWFAGGRDAEVEFELELDLDGLQDLSVQGPAAAQPAPAAEPELPQRLASPPLAPSQPSVEPPAMAKPALDFDLGGLEAAQEAAYEIDWSFEPEPALDLPAMERTPASASPISPVLNLEELERTSFEVAAAHTPEAPRPDDLLAEAEVFRKYGLREKAHDRVREILQINPRHVGANGLLVSLWIDEGKHDKALLRARQLRQLAIEGRDESVWHQVRNRLVKAGFRIEGEEIVDLPVPQPKKKDKISALLDDLAGVATPVRSAAPRPTAKSPGVSAPPPKPPVAAPPSAPPMVAPAARPAASIAPAAAAPAALAPPAAAPPLPPPIVSPPAAATPPAKAPLDLPPPARPAARSISATELTSEPWHAGLHESGPLDDELPEIVIPIARPPLGAAPTAPPPAARGAAPGKISPPVTPTAVPAAAPPPTSPPAKPVTPEKVAADESLSWLDQAVAAPTTSRGADGGEGLFDDEEGFFDLAAELEQELSKEDLLSGRDLMPTPQEQSLEEIVEGFKRGVSESLSSEDYDTHYNLGIAYREMGLLDEAIGEFQLAAKEPRYLVDCASLLGGCFLEKGLPELAIKWYQRGLEIPGLPEEAFLGMLYDLGNVYLLQGDFEKAHKTFVEIYGVNSNYRDVVAKLTELDHPR